MNYDHNQFLGYLNFSRAIENSFWIAQKAIVEKILTRSLGSVLENYTMTVWNKAHIVYSIWWYRLQNN